MFFQCLKKQNKTNKKKTSPFAFRPLIQLELIFSEYEFEINLFQKKIELNGQKKDLTPSSERAFTDLKCHIVLFHKLQQIQGKGMLLLYGSTPELKGFNFAVNFSIWYGKSFSWGWS